MAKIDVVITKLEDMEKNHNEKFEELKDRLDKLNGQVFSNTKFRWVVYGAGSILASLSGSALFVAVFIK